MCSSLLHVPAVPDEAFSCGPDDDDRDWVASVTHSEQAQGVFHVQRRGRGARWGVIIGFDGKDVPHGWWSRFSEKWPFYIAYMVEHP